MQRLTWRLKFIIQPLFFALADVLIVEAEHVKTGLERRRLLDSLPIHVVPNCPDSIFWSGQMVKPGHTGGKGTDSARACPTCASPQEPGHLPHGEAGTS